jgi:hypothetical protein
MARRKEPAPVCCSHWRVVTSGQLQMVASRSRVSGSIRRRGFFMFQLAARAALPVRLDAHRPGSVVYVVVRLKNVQTCQQSCGRQLLHTNPNSCACIGPCGESPAGRCPCCGHRRVSHRSGGSGPSSGAMVRSHARRGRRTAPRIRRRAREIRAKHATSGFPRRHLLQIPPPQFRRDW